MSRRCREREREGDYNNGGARFSASFETERKRAPTPECFIHHRDFAADWRKILDALGEKKKKKPSSPSPSITPHHWGRGEERERVDSIFVRCICQGVAGAKA